eukprot:scaffold560924_cov56-Prasinocladus_malaysianus.AAC.1
MYHCHQHIFSCVWIDGTLIQPVCAGCKPQAFSSADKQPVGWPHVPLRLPRDARLVRILDHCLPPPAISYAKADNSLPCGFCQLAANKLLPKGARWCGVDKLSQPRSFLGGVTVWILLTASSSIHGDTVFMYNWIVHDIISYYITTYSVT